MIRSKFLAVLSRGDGSRDYVERGVKKGGFQTRRKRGHVRALGC